MLRMYCRNKAMMHSRSEHVDESIPRSGWRRLVVTIGLIVVLWVGILPRLGELPAVQRRMQLLDRHNINPAALFYTELDCMDEVEKQMATTRAKYPRAFWPTP